MLGPELKKATGFTLVEAITVVAIIAILAAVAVPSFKSTLDASRVRKAADHIAQTIALAQSQALNRNVDVYLSVTTGTPPTLCVSTTVATATGHTCDVLSTATSNGTSVMLSKAVAGTTATQVVFSGLNGRPDSAATFAVSANTASKSVVINVIGLVSLAS